MVDKRDAGLLRNVNELNGIGPRSGGAQPERGGESKEAKLHDIGAGEDETAAVNVAKKSHGAVSNFSCRNISTFRLGIVIFERLM